MPPPLLALPPTIAWRGDELGYLEVLDQTRLPHERSVLRIDTVDQTIEAIVRLRVRGAPAIGVAAAYGLVLGVRALAPLPAAFVDTTRDVAARLGAARPTAVNLQAALDRCLHAVLAEPKLQRLYRVAKAIHAE